MKRPTRRQTLLALGGGIAALSGCLGGNTSGGGDDGGGTGGGSTDTTDGSGTTSGSSDASGSSGSASGPPTAATTLPMMWEASTLREKTLSGGPPKDGIPSIDSPQFEAAGDVGERLLDEDVVFGVVRDGEVKAYPQNILVWHEIVNDTLGGTPVTVSYCPLTGTAQGFLRGETTFGVSGKLVNSNLVMYDRATDSRWPQVLGTAVRGPFEGSSLEEFRVVWTTWGRWREAHPDTLVLTEKTGHARNYNRDPYGDYTPQPTGYYTSGRTLFSPLETSDQYQAKELVIGVSDTDLGVHAFHKGTLRDQGLMRANDGELLVAYEPTLDTAYAYHNPDGASFEYADGTVEGPDGGHDPDSLPLDSVIGFDAMWFAWFGFYPETEVHG